MHKTPCSVLVLASTFFACPLVASEPAPAISTTPGQIAPPAVISAEDTDHVLAPAPAPATGAPTQATQGEPAGDRANAAPTSARQTAHPSTGSPPDGSRSYHEWIDEVRAQRQARVNEYRKAMGARRNYPAPWDHQPHENIKRQREKMREARQNRAEWRDQAQREHWRWTDPHSEFLIDMHEAHLQFMEDQAEMQRKQMDFMWQQQDRWIYGQRPYGWDNPWYYRGY